MKILRKQILPRFVKISFLFCLKYILISASLPSMVGRFSSSLASLSPGISPSLSAFRVIVLMLRVCFKPIRLFQMYHTKHTRGIKNVDLNTAKTIVGVAINWEEL